MLKSNIETFIGCDSSYEESRIVLFGAPFDSTTSYRPGARFASRAIRGESFGLETYSPYLDRDLTDTAIFDSGDLELPMGSSELSLQAIRERTAIILKDGKLPVMIGGEHLVTLGAVQAVAKQYPDLHILHFDAHADLRHDYLGITLSHACVIRRCWDITGDGRIHQFGIRSGDRSEFTWARQGHVSTHLYNFDGLNEAIRLLKGHPVYLTIDLDVLDPSVLPGTGTPEAGGVSFEQLRSAIELVCQELTIAGCDVNELCPACDLSGASTATACKLVRELLLSLYRF